MSAENQRVTVAVRVRPILRDGANMHAQEKFELQGVHCTSDTTLKVEVTREGEPTKSSTFSFDHLFDQESTQLEVYEDAVVDLVDAALVGVNATLLAYGQTGSGKTFSVLGEVKPNPLENDLLTPESGMFLRVLSDLMEYRARRAQKGWHVVVGLSCIEVYNEQIRDLFGGESNQPPPPIKAVMIGEDVLMPSLMVKELTSLQAVFKEIQLAISRRKSRATESNASSSRSHCIFSIDILQQANTAPCPSLDVLDISRNRDKDGNPTVRRTGLTPSSPRTPQADKANLPPYEMPFQGLVLRNGGQKEPIYASKIVLADLAGSERISRSGVSGQGLAEATAINSSLTALGNVVHSLYEGGYVSYRTSNLTRLLKPSFQHPNSRVLLLAQCSPTQLTFEETVSTLHFANKVKAMKVTSVTGSEAEKLLFEYLNVAKTCDAILADLHIFHEESYAKPAVIRRRTPQHNGLYYSNTVEPSSPTVNGKTPAISSKGRGPALEAMGVLPPAQRERSEIQARLDKEKAEQASIINKEVAEERERLVKEHAARMKEAKDGIREARRVRLHHRTQRLAIASSAASGTIMMEEEASRAALLAAFRKAHVIACTRELARRTASVEALSKDLSKQAATEKVEVASTDHLYAQSAWSHCVAKRFFSKGMELLELDRLLLKMAVGNAGLQRWIAANKKSIDGTG